jgi:VanZ family protein
VRLPSGERRAGPAPARSARAIWPWVPVIAYMGLIFYLSSLSDPLPELTRHVWDKALHFTEYGALGAMLAFAFRASGVRGWRALAVAAVVASLYAVTDEIHQAFVPGRDSDIHDWLADTLGGALGVGAMAVALRLRRLQASIRPARRRT